MYNELVSIYAEILKGYSSLKPSVKAYFKHPGPLEISVLEEERISFYNHAIQSGLPSEKDQLTYLNKEGLWTDKDETGLTDVKLMLRGLNDSKEKVALKSQIAAIKQQIVEYEKKLNELERKKAELLGLTVESITNKQSNEFFIWYTLYSDDKCSEHYLSRYDFDCLNDKELGAIIVAQNKVVNRFNTKSLQKIALANFFTNFFYLCDNNPYTFYGKPLIHLSNYQVELFGLGTYYKSLISRHEGKVPEELYEKPDELVEWVTAAANSKKLLDKSGNSEAVGLVGATKEDLAAINAPVIDLAKEARKKGGKLSMKDLMQIHGA